MDIINEDGKESVKILEIGVTPKQFEGLEKKTDFVLLLTYGVLIALFLGFVGMLATLTGILTDTWRYNVNSYIDYQKSENANTAIITTIEERIQKLEGKIK